MFPCVAFCNLCEGIRLCVETRTGCEMFGQVCAVTSVPIEWFGNVGMKVGVEHPFPSSQDNFDAN